MAHEVEQMAYAGATPWHGLGNKINKFAPIETWQEQAGLDWTVSKRPVQYCNSEFDVNTGSNVIMPFKDRFVLARDTDDKPFAVVSGRYKPVQPKEILEFFRTLTEHFGMTIETAGSLRDGRRVWCMANTGEAHKVMGVDEVKGYCMLGTSYDLTFSTLAYFTSVRVVCNNTLQQSFGDMVSLVKIPHMREFKMDDVKDQLGVGQAQWMSFTNMLDTLARINLDTAKATETLNKVFQVTTEKTSAANEVNKQHVSKVIELFSGAAIGSDVAGQTGWGLVNSVTEYLDKHRRARNEGNRLDSAWFGDGFNTKQRIVDETLLLA